MRQAFPDATGFSHTNVKYMKQWYSFYFKQITKSQRAVGQIHPQVGGEFGKKEKSHQLGDQLEQTVNIKDVSSERRNPILANVMAQLDYMEKRGSGLSRICNETKALEGYKDELKPVFKSTPTQFQTIIFSSSDTPNVGDHDGDMSETKLTERQQKILNLIKESPTNTGKQMSETLSVSQRTIERDLSAMQKIGIIKHEGKDNDGVWHIISIKTYNH